MPSQISISKHIHIHHDEGFSQGSRSIYVVHNTAECKYTVSSNIDESTWPWAAVGETQKATSPV